MKKLECMFLKKYFRHLYDRKNTFQGTMLYSKHSLHMSICLFLYLAAKEVRKYYEKKIPTKTKA